MTQTTHSGEKRWTRLVSLVYPGGGERRSVVVSFVLALQEMLFLRPVKLHLLGLDSAPHDRKNLLSSLSVVLKTWVRH